MVRGPAKKCPNCTYKTNFGTREVPRAMRRLYIKRRGTFVAVGWLCPRCGHVSLDDRFLTLPGSPNREAIRRELDEANRDRKLILDLVNQVLTEFFLEDMPNAPDLARAIATKLWLKIVLLYEKANLDEMLKEGILERDEYDVELRRLERRASVYGFKLR